MIKLIQAQNRREIILNPAFIQSVYENDSGYTKVVMSDGTIHTVDESVRAIQHEILCKSK